MSNKTGLILEGGGFRGIYSAGFLDYFLEYKIEFPYVIGVSMGACNGVNYISILLDINSTLLNKKLQ